VLSAFIAAGRSSVISPIPAEPVKMITPSSLIPAD
jgi:hypothetical protein